MTTITKVSQLIANDDPEKFASELNHVRAEHPGAEVHYSFAVGKFGPVFSALLLWTEEMAPPK